MTERLLHNQAQSNQTGICLATMSFYPLYAGPAVRFQRYAPEMAKLGIAMQVYTQAITPELISRDGSLANGAPTSNGRLTWPLAESIAGLPVQRVELPTGWRRQMSYFSQLLHHCQEKRDEIDVVQFLNLGIWAAPQLRQLARLRIGRVYTHTLMGALSTNRWRRRWQRFHRKIPFNLVDCVVVSSVTMQRQLKALGVTAPIQVIPNGVDLQRFVPIANEDRKAELRQQLGLPPQGQIILAIGPIVPRKGTDVLVHAFTTLYRDYPEAYLLLVGPRHDLGRDSLGDFRRQLDETIRTTGAQDRVIFTGAVSNVQAYLQAADLLVFPSRREGMPNVVPEAMASGLPVIVTPFIGLPEEFGHPEEHYVLSDWKPEALAADIRLLLRDPARRQTLGAAGRQWVEQRLDVTQSLAAYAELYRHVKRI